jgi:hypothetical protein
MVIVKLDLAGAYQWHTFYGSTSGASGYGIAVTGDSVYVTGESNATWNGDGNAAPKHAYSGDADIVIVKLNSGGAYQWHTFYGSPSGDYGRCIAVTGDGVCVTGESYATWNGDGDTASEHAYSGDADIVILKIFDPTQPIPTVTEWGMGVMMLMLALTSYGVLRRRRA